MTVQSVTINGQPATFTFKQPTYPGNPNGQDDPDPLAHAASNSNPVSATNPNPPACAPIGNAAALQGAQCPANKLVITPVGADPGGSGLQGRRSTTRAAPASTSTVTAPPRAGSATTTRSATAAS